MAIDFAPPGPELQPFNVTPVAQPDPLGTLAQLGQMRTQRLQQQTAGMQLEQERQSLDSAKAIMQIMAETKPGETFQQTLARATATGKILPSHLKQMGDASIQWQKDLDALDDNKRKRMKDGISTIRPMYEAVTDQPSLDEANAAAKKRGVPEELLMTRYTDPSHLTAHVKSLIPVEQALDEKVKQAQLDRDTAAQGLTAVQTNEARQKLGDMQLAAARTALQSAAVDPQTGTPTPAAVADIRARFPNVQLPMGNAPREDWDRFLTSDLSTKDRMELARPKSDVDLAVRANDPNLPREEREHAAAAFKALQGLRNPDNSVTELAIAATNPKLPQADRDAAQAALDRVIKTNVASRPVINNLIPGVATGPATGDKGQLHGEDFLKTLPPSFAARIKNMATGNEGAPSGRAASQGAGLQIMNALYQYDPEFTPLLAQQRRDILKEFTNTGMTHAGGQRLALNTLIHHADLYLDAAAALKNGTFKPGNEIYNKVATMFGAAPPTNAALLAQFFAGETGKVATGGVPAEGEIKKILENMSTAGSPAAMEGAGKTLIGIAAGRMVPLKELRDKAGLGKFVDILGPDAQEILQRRGFDPETMKPLAAAKATSGSAAPEFIKVGGKRYKYNGSGSRQDLNNYTEVPAK